MARPRIARSIARTAALATALAVAACRLPLAPSSTTARLSAQAYPPPGAPTATPAPSPTPTADADGLLPPPAQPPSQPVGLGDGPYADIVVPLQSALAAGDDGWFGAHVGARRGLRLFDIDQLESEGGASVDAAGTASLAEAFFAAGARPRVQGYFEEARPTTRCLYVLTHPWRGEVDYPGYAADHGIAERAGPALPPTVPLDAAALHLCRDQLGAWTMDAWIHGGHYRIIERLAGHAPPWPLFVIRP